MSVICSTSLAKEQLAALFFNPLDENGRPKNFASTLTNLLKLITKGHQLASA
jgi:hypothetical protein